MPNNLNPGLLPQGNFTGYDTLAAADAALLFKYAGQIIYEISTDTFYYWNGTAWMTFGSGGGGGGTVWGTITGNVLNQTDIITYINTPRVVNQLGGAIITIDPNTTDSHLMRLDQNTKLDYITGGVDEQIIVLKLFTASGINYNFSVNALYKIYNGVIIPPLLNNLQVTTLVLMFDAPSGLWTIYNCSTVTVL